MISPRRLALDMATIPTDMSEFHKRVIEDGFAPPFGEAMALEHQRSSGWNARITPEIVELNRRAVLARGRTQ